MHLPIGAVPLELDGPYLGHLDDHTALRDDFPALRERLASDGYLRIRGLHDPAAVQAARQRLLQNLAANEQLDPARPLDEAWIAPGAKGQFLGGAKAVSHTPEFLKVVESPALLAWFANLLEGPALTFDYKWIRAIGHGANTGAHFDVVYMGRGTKRLYTVWTPLGDLTYDLGTLAILAGSPNLDRVRQTYGEMDVDRDNVEGWFSKDPRELVDRYGGRWLTAEFAMGDALVFGMYTMHCSTNNTSQRLRLSCDTRYQRADEPADERWVGANPKAHYAWGQGETVSMATMRERWGV
ncbi:MAG: phytanoyl-CoA dioxygenase family protein [Fimbriimonadaceae bacterium]|nr:phytanoyl-CoA dioxygenase family protein [Fimbriimonadaceae bacterium]